MAATLYPYFVDQAFQGNVDLPAADLRATLVDVADYTFSAAHDFYDDVPSPARVAEFTMSSVSFGSAVLDAADGVWPTVTGDPCEALVIRVYNATASASLLVAYIDGFTVTPDGTDINCVWDNGANKIFKIG